MSWLCLGSVYSIKILFNRVLYNNNNNNNNDDENNTDHKHARLVTCVETINSIRPESV